MKKPLFLLVGFCCANLLTIFTYSCKKTYTDKCNTSLHYVCTKLNNIVVTPHQLSNNISLSSGQEVRATNLYLLADFSGENITCFKRSYTNPFITAAYACTPPVAYKHKDAIVYISITSDADFDATHPAGTLLNDYFDMPELDKLNAMEYSSGGNDQRKSSYFSIPLQQAPAQKGKHSFTLQVKMAGGDTYSATCVPVVLVK